MRQVTGRGSEPLRAARAVCSGDCPAEYEFTYRDYLSLSPDGRSRPEVVFGRDLG